MEGNTPVIANSSTTTFTYNSLGLKSYTTIKNEQETTVNLETTVLDQGVGYLIHQQLNNTINKYASSRNIDYRLKAEIPSTINISRGCVF